MGRKTYRRWQWVLRCAFCATATLLSVPALADGDNFFQSLLQNLQKVAAQSAWHNIDPAVQDCMASQYNLKTADLASQGIGPNDSRVSDDIANCQKMIAPRQTQNQSNDDPAARLKELTAKYGRKAAKEIAAGNIDIGMNEDEVVATWGDPNDREQEAHGKENWVYGHDAVTFTHGKITAVGH